MAGNTLHDEDGSSPAGGAPPLTSDTAEPTLAMLMASFTRRCPDAMLALMAVIGIGGSLALAWFAPRAWRLLPAFLLLAAAGSWGIAERERDSTGARATAFAIVRALAVLVSVGAVALLAFAFFGLTLGTWIS